MEIIIRESCTEDFTDIYLLFHQLWPTKELNEANMRIVFHRGLQSSNDHYISGIIDNHVIGFCAVAIVNNFWQEGVIAFVYAMVIDDKYRGMGYGVAIMEKAYEYARSKGCTKMELDSAFHREGAHKFYERLGFEKRAFLFSKDI